MKGVIYCATNTVNGKKYVGKSKSYVKFKGRRNYHQRKAREGSSFVFHRAIRKYGEESFKWTILYYGEDDLNVKEKEFIAKLDSKANGYNTTDRLKQSKTMKGRIITPEHRRKLSESLMGNNKGKTYEEMYGKEKAMELKEKRRLVWLGNSCRYGKRKTKKGVANVN